MLCKCKCYAIIGDNSIDSIEIIYCIHRVDQLCCICPIKVAIILHYSTPAKTKEGKNQKKRSQFLKVN